MLLIEPTMEYDRAIQAFRRDFSEHGDMDGSGNLRRFERTEEWLAYLETMKRAETAAPGKVPATQYIYLREEDGKIVGVLQIRHFLNDYLERYAGHIGYSVRPGERRKGYAKRMLAMGLEEARALGLKRVMISCAEGNEGSRRTILANGGVFHSTIWDEEDQETLERYWIEL